MEALKENLEETEIGSSPKSFQRFLDLQRELFHCQIDQLQRAVVTQCKLTGVNPLAQEMAAGALSIKIGKRPRDLLNPKAVKYMQAIFSVKDAISKKESREISAQFGVTVTQVREFFNSQRTRVRKLVRLSREKAVRANACKEPQDGIPTSSDSIISVNAVPLNSIGPNPIPVNSVGPDPGPLNSVGNLVLLNSVGTDVAPLNSVGPNPALVNSLGTNPAPLNSVDPTNAEDAPSCSKQDENLPGLDGLDKHFVENIFSLLRKEETFSGQVKLMEWILQIQNPSVLNWFLLQGGVMVLATWLSQAAVEEQTTVLCVTLNVLYHLPLHKALPEHMSAILHSVNNLRFYRTSDISNRARVLLARWSKMFARSQAMKKPNGMKSSTDAQEMILKQSIDEIMGNELWVPSVINPDDALALSSGTSENMRKTELPQALKLLPASADDPSRKHILGVSSSHTKQRRKVKLVEEPGQKTAGRSPQATKPVPVSQSRPMSADDIQKAKMRAVYRQNKYGKTGSSSNGNNGSKTGGLNKLFRAPTSNLSPVSKVPVQPKIEEQKKTVILPEKDTNKHGESSLNLQPKLDPNESLGELLSRIKIPWRMPPEIKHNDLWRVGTGEHSKEVDIQKTRNRREMETMYRAFHEIPSNPKEPWDVEMDYDDTLTPEIPIEQPPDADGAEVPVSNNGNINTVVPSVPSLPQADGGGAAEPDLELLAVLLKNPELVFALTSSQAGSLSSEETVKLLDMIKRGGLAGNLNGFVAAAQEKVEVSLPSPTPPSSTPGTSGWRQEVAKNPFSQQNSVDNGVACNDPRASTTIPYAEKLTTLLQPLHQATNIGLSKQQAIPSQQAQVIISPSFSLPQATPTMAGRRQSTMVPLSHHLPHNSSLLVTPVPEMKILPISTPGASGPPMQVEAANNIKPTSSVPYTMNTPENQPISLSSSHMVPKPTQTTRLQLQPHLATEPSNLYSFRLPSGNMGPVPDSWRSRATNSLSQVNPNAFDTPYVSQHQLQSGSPWEKNEGMGDEGFESWSPDNSPRRSSEYISGRNYVGPGTNSGWNYRHDSRPRQRDSSGRDGNRRWR